MTDPAPTTKKPSPLLPIFLIVLVDVLGLTIILPLLPFYAEKLGATPFVVGLLVSSYALCQLIAGPILGRISDTTGRKPLLIVSQVGTFIGFLILAASNTLWLVFLSRVIDGLTAGNLSLAQAYIADVTEPKDRAKSFGIIGIAFGIGFLIGPATSGWLAGFGFVYPILLAAALSFTSILATTFLLPGGRVARHADSGPAGPGGKRLGVLDWGAYAQYFRRRELGPYLWQFFAFAFAFATFVSGFALFCERRFSWPTHSMTVVAPAQVVFKNESPERQTITFDAPCRTIASFSVDPGAKASIAMPEIAESCPFHAGRNLEGTITIASPVNAKGGGLNEWILRPDEMRSPFGTRQVGFVFAYVGFLGIILQGGLLGRMVKRFGEVRLVQAGFLSAAIGYALFGYTFGLPMLVLVATVNSFGSGVLRPAITSLITQNASNAEQGVVLGLSQSLMSVAQIIGPLIAGALIEHDLLIVWALVPGAFALAGFFIRATPPAGARA